MVAWICTSINEKGRGYSSHIRICGVTLLNVASFNLGVCIFTRKIYEFTCMYQSWTRYILACWESTLQQCLIFVLITARTTTSTESLLNCQSQAHDTYYVSDVCNHIIQCTSNKDKKKEREREKNCLQSLLWKLSVWDKYFLKTLLWKRDSRVCVVKKNHSDPISAHYASI